MKASFLSVAAAIVLFGSSLGAQVRDNAGATLPKDAGRIVPMQKVATVPPSGDGYSLVNPEAVRVRADGWMFVADRNQLLAFDASGRFVRAYRASTAPESCRFNHLQLTNTSLVTFDMSAQRVHVFDIASGADRSFAVAVPDTGRRGPGAILVFVDKAGRVYLSHNDQIFTYTLDGKKEGLDVPLTVDRIVSSERTGQGGAEHGMQVGVRTARDGDTGMFFCASLDYLVARMDLATGEITNAFRRDYPHVMYATPQVFPHRPDIGALVSEGNRLWVVTSTFDKAKGNLVDVFDTEGRYVDTFYLQAVNGETIANINGALNGFGARSVALILRQPADRTVSIVRFALPAPGGTAQDAR